MRRIVWLASYPKSGNTWFRALLANLQRDRHEPASLGDLGAPVASARVRFDRVAGIETSDLTAEEIEDLRRLTYRHLALSAEGEEPQFFKIHDAFCRASDAAPVIPLDVTLGAIYLVRSPLDICASYAHHSSIDFDASIRMLADENGALCPRRDRIETQLYQHLSSWSGHVRSWLDNGRIPVHHVRYEDLVARPVETVTSALAFAGLERGRPEIERAIEWSSFERLQAQERELGFAEKPSAMRSFFRQGTAGAWRRELTPEQVARITRDHASTMHRLGYLDYAGQVH